MYTKEKIINKLDKSKYAGRYHIYDTYLDQNMTRWKYGDRLKYENKLRDDGLKHFAFIKFCLGRNGEKVGLVGGKSASKNVIGRSDLNFSTNPDHGKARKWLFEEDSKWCHTEVLIIGANAENDDENRTEAFEIEQDLKSMFELFGS